MANNNVPYFFGRLNLLPVHEYEIKKKRLFEGFSSGYQLADHGVFWKFFQIELVQTVFGEVIHGSFGKFRNQIFEVKQGKNDIALAEVDDRIIGRSPFYLHLKSGLIAYHPIPNVIPPELFRTRFSQVLDHGVGAFFESELDNVVDEETIEQAIRRFNKIIKVRTTLHPSNPSFRAEWKDLDTRIKNLRATRYKEEYEAPRDPELPGLNIESDLDFRKKLLMAEDGYGEMYVLGSIGGIERSVTTKRGVIKAFAPGKEEQPKFVLEQLREIFERIMSRFSHSAEPSSERSPRDER